MPELVKSYMLQRSKNLNKDLEMSKADIVSSFKVTPLDFDGTEQTKIKGPM
jgi:hypothetical protein